MNVSDVLIELYGRIGPHVHTAVTGLDAEALATAPEPDANPIGWLVWHLTRVEDDHLSEVLEAEQIWVTGNWAPRFGLAPGSHDTGFGHTSQQVAAVRPDGPQALTGYHDAVAARTHEFLRGLTPDDLARVIDWAWEPPVTLGVRLVSVADDAIQHAGQANYVRGLLTRRGRQRAPSRGGRVDGNT